jgi:putative hydrolase of the HAD superfamily
MIKAISFDFYNTLVRFWPPLDEIQQAACRELGLNVSKVAIDRGYSFADAYFNQENGREPLALRTEEERIAFFTRYEQIILENAGVPVSAHLARQIWDIAMFVPKDFIPYEDVIPALEALRSQGYRLGILSNLRRDMSALCQRLGLAPYLDFYINSAEAGAEKPHRPIFQAALEKMATTPGEAVHVGDQYQSDVLGARAVGMHSVLIDRRGWNAKFNDCPRITNLFELQELLANAPHSLTTDHRKSQE